MYKLGKTFLRRSILIGEHSFDCFELLYKFYLNGFQQKKKTKMYNSDSNMTIFVEFC